MLLEVGPGQTLTTLARQHPSKTAEQMVLASLPLAGDEELRGLLETLGRLWTAGCDVDWKAFYASEQRRRMVLPAYPFERKRFWPESAPVGARPALAGAELVTAAPTSSANIAQTVQSRPVQEVSSPGPASPPVPDSTTIPRRARLLAASRSLLEELSGYDLRGVDPTTGVLELGLDSLLLTQAATLFQRKFGVRVTFRQLMEELNSLDAIASYLDAQLPSDAFAAATTEAIPVVEPQTPVAAAHPPAAAGIPHALLEQLLLQQQQLTNQVLALMGKQPATTPAAASAAATPSAPTAPAVWTAPKGDGRSHGPFKPMDRAAGSRFTPTQSRALKELIERYTRRTAGSKKIAAQNRPILSDPRSVAGFKQSWKEMVYPIVTARSQGSKVWDVDGNEYVDFVMGFGASLFGHRPPFVVDAVQEQLALGFEIGPIQPLAGEVAALLRELTGMERVAFTNTGSEAVLAATRVSRTVTGRDKIAVFAGAYHGIFDEVLFRPVTRDGEPRAAAIAPGIPQSALDQVIVLDYGNPQSLDYLRARGSEIAAVLVEPVQSRRLDLQPKEFLHELRRVTEQSGSALIFDEVVNGFRLHPGGAQAYYGVRADLATYGKVIGGGLPIGVVTGAAKFMDALDGGSWQYGDDSFPEVGVTFFAGTFMRHPLALAAAKAVLTHLKEEGPGLQQRLNERTARLSHELQAILDDYAAPYRLTQFSSQMHLTYPADEKFAGLLFFLLRDRGIHILDNRGFIVTTAHDDEDFGKLSDALRESLAEMRSGDFFEGAVSSPALPKQSKNELIALARADAPTEVLPLTEAQKEIWLAAQMSADAAVAYNESLKLEFRGPFDVDLFRAAAQQVVTRHRILFSSFSEDGQSYRLITDPHFDLPLLDVSGAADSDRARTLSDLIERATSEPFDLVKGPLLRAQIVRVSADHHVVIWTTHHIVCDGWSIGLILNELARIYSART
ncbi:MAG TPA: aminotransferase class III-fold pyridoxal phosphate-dependent enzyme, partial [Gemmataceae bacterium]|nr:aminotransferase class III-fold pyridoxal phosphate-dependent enzyme [Gemmataceae bacterium]